MTKSGVSIIICTYNGSYVIEKTLEYLANQKHNIPVEIVLVDNASTDNTKQLADEWWNAHGTESLDYRSFIQSIPGKSYAQEMGYAKARYEYLLICDDDNWLNPNYIQNAYEIMKGNTVIGALGGWGIAESEVSKPGWFEKYGKYYATVKQGKKSGDITNAKGCLYGAGMLIRKSHWIELNDLGFRPLLTCRKGNSLSSGGDTEYCYALRLIGYRIWYDEQLHFKHFISSKRSNFEYIRKLRKTMSVSNFVVRPYLDKIKGDVVSEKDFKKQFLVSIRKKLMVNIKKGITGTFIEKEDAKDYFRYLKHLAFSYREYRKNLEILESWLKKASLN